MLAFCAYEFQFQRIWQSAHRNFFLHINPHYFGLPFCIILHGTFLILHAYDESTGERERELEQEGTCALGSTPLG